MSALQKIKTTAHRVLRKVGLESKPSRADAPAQTLLAEFEAIPGETIRMRTCFPSMAQGTHDEFLYEALKKRNLPLAGATVWDVGAHFGYHTLRFAALSGTSGRVIAFEPNPHNLQMLRENLDLNPHLSGRIQIVDCAVADSDGTQTLRCSDDDSISDIGFLQKSGQPANRVRQASYDRLRDVSVYTRSLDSLVHQGIAKPQIIKIDVEGAEALVLEGATEVLQWRKASLLIEIHNISCMFSCLQTLATFGYRNELLDDGPRSPSRGFIMCRP